MDKIALTRAAKEILKRELPEAGLVILRAHERSLRPLERIRKGLKRGTENIIKREEITVGAPFGKIPDWSYRPPLFHFSVSKHTPAGGVIGIPPVKERSLARRFAVWAGKTKPSEEELRTLDEIFRRHETYEALAYKKLRAQKNAKVWIPTTFLFGIPGGQHFSPSVLVREGKDVGLIGGNIEKMMKGMREISGEAPLMGRAGIPYGKLVPKSQTRKGIAILTKQEPEKISPWLQPIWLSPTGRYGLSLGGAAKGLGATAAAGTIIDSGALIAGRKRRQTKTANSALSVESLSFLESMLKWAVPNKVTVKVEGVPIRVEVARTGAEQKKGLMFREELGPDEGMLFVFDRPGPRSFWMRNVRFPLDIIFFGPDGNELGRHTNAEPMSDDPRNCSGPVQYVLEAPGGFLDRHNVPHDARLEL